jgi:hypothetical protein
MDLSDAVDGIQPKQFTVLVLLSDEVFFVISEKQLSGISGFFNHLHAFVLHERKGNANCFGWAKCSMMPA